MSEMKICVVSGSRAEFGQLLPLLNEIMKDPFFSLDFVITGMHCVPNSPSIGEINNSQIPITGQIPINNIIDNSDKGIAIQIGEIIQKSAQYFSQKRPDLLIIIGDRYEMMGISVAAYTLLIPIAHICGGSSTSGALDEAYRHSISKMSSLHFTTCEMYKKRVIQLGEHPNKVFNVGSLAIENCLHVELLSKEEIKQDVGVPLDKPYCVVTFHPETMEECSQCDELREVIEALNVFKEYYYVITLSNVDSGGNAINDLWNEEAKKHDNFIIVASLGTKRYLSALKHSEMMIGNSSSGTTEGPAMHIPTIDIGDRQKGRFFAQSLVHCKTKKDDIVKAIKKAKSEDFKEMVRNVDNPFGDGTTSKKIVSILKEQKNNLTPKKDFYDIDFIMKNK